MKNLDGDRDLVRRCLNNNRRAQEELYEKYRVPLFGLCLRYAKDESQASDFLQEGFIKVFNSLHQYRGEGTLYKWMERVFINKIISILRKKKVTFNNEVDLERIPDVPTEKKDTKKQVDKVIQLIQQLPEGYQAVFNLYAIEGYSHKEISEILDISESTSRSQYYRAKTAVKKAMQQLKSVES